MQVQGASPAARLAAAIVAFASAVSLAHAQAGARTVRELESELAKRDALINDLQRRVQALEERLRQTASPPSATAQALTSAPRPTSQQPADDASDEEVLARALERSLVRSGAVLLTRGQWELEPGVQYDYTRRSGLGIEGATVVSKDFRRETYMLGLGLRVGLPWSSQLELAIPYGRQRVESVTGAAASTSAETGLGDIQLGISKQLRAEREGRPGLIGNLTLQRSTGASNLGLLAIPTAGSLAATPSLGTGYDALHARLTATKRMDPLVFVGSVAHSFNHSTNAGGARVKASDSNTVGFRAILAASPEVSLRTGFSLTRSGDFRINGTPLAGSRQTVGILELGGSWSLSRSMLLDLFIGTALTEESPDFMIGMALPIRF